MGSSRSVPTQSAKSTVPRSRFTLYWTLVACSRVSHVPDRFDTIGIFGFRRPLLWQLVILQLGFLFGNRGRSEGSFGVRTGRQIGSFDMRRRHLHPNFNGRRAERVVELERA